MKDIPLIKQMNESIRDKDEFEKALDEAGIEFDMGDGETEELPNGGEFDNGSDDELQRIADHWEAEGAEMSDDELRDAIGDDLEQLEYSPEEISDGIDQVMSMLGRGEGDMEPDVDERQELEDFEQADEYFGGGDEHI